MQHLVYFSRTYTRLESQCKIHESSQRSKGREIDYWSMTENSGDGCWGLIVDMIGRGDLDEVKVFVNGHHKGICPNLKFHVSIFHSLI